MTDTIYEDIIKNDNKIRWYGVMIPESLKTKLVIEASKPMMDQINLLESEVDSLKGISKTKMSNRIKSIRANIQNLPYVLNGDVYLKKKKRIEGSKKTKVIKATRRKNDTNIRRNMQGSKEAPIKGAWLLYFWIQSLWNIKL